MSACAGPGDPVDGAGSSPGGEEPPADLVVRNGRVWTGDAEGSRAEAVLVRGAWIEAVGNGAEIAALAAPDARVVDAGGGMVVPGFIDAHVHFLAGGMRLSSVQLRDAGSPEELTRRIAHFADRLEPGEWITGGDWDHENWGGELPRRDWIDAVTPDNPVWVSRLDGHMALANGAALEAAGVDATTGDLEGGEIVRDAAGEPTGILKDNAMSLVAAAVPEPGDARLDAALQVAMDHVAARGVTSVHHMGTYEDLAVFQRARDAGTMRTRVYASIPLERWERLAQRVQAFGTGDEWVRIGGLKGFVDGSLGSHTAAFLEPYDDAPGDTGLLVSSPEDLHEWITAADEARLHVSVHAIGDRAIRLLLDTYERVAAEQPPWDRRYRVEHAQHIAPADIPRFAELGVIASMQPYHAIDDGRWAERLIGEERAATTYAFRSLLDVGARLAFGSDWFVAPPSPLEGIHAAVTRRTLDGEHPGGWVPEQRIGVEEALRAYTLDAAYAAFEEGLKGSLEPGKLGDLVVLDRDLTAIAPGEIRDARVLVTVVGGEIVHDARNSR